MPLSSPFISQRRSRRAARVGVRPLALILCLAALGGAAALIASATQSHAARAAGAARAPRASRGPLLASRLPALPLRPSPSPLSSAQLEQRAIDHVLGYTPFVRAGAAHRRLIALTFDDGPSPYTPAIVAELVRLHVPATFFIVGQQLRYFAAGLRDEIRHGFAIGDHTENHPPLALLSPALQYFQIHAAAVQITRLGAPFPRLFRPPYAVYDAQTFAILRRLHMLMVMWSVDPRDWTRPGVAVIVRRVLADARPGAIVELHDGGGDRSQTLAALPAIVAGLRRRGYEFVTVPQLLVSDPPPRGQSLPPLSE